MKKNIKKKNFSLFSNIIFSLIALFALTVSFVFLFVNRSLENKLSVQEQEIDELVEYKDKYKYTEQEMKDSVEKVKEEENEEAKNELLNSMRNVMEANESMIGLLRSMFPDDVILTTSKGFQSFPINTTQKLNEYKLDNFIVEDNDDGDVKEIIYVNDIGDVLSIKGIDVSSFQGVIDWEKVKNDGVEFAFIRVGLRGDTEGKLMLDSKFEDNIKGATDAGIDVGVYFYTQAISKEEAVEEAEFVLEAIEPYEITYPIAFDIEDNKGGRNASLTMEEYTDITRSFVDTISKSGYNPMIYGNLRTMFYMIDQSLFEDVNKWFAYYNKELYYPYDFAIWQYSSTGTVDGIDGMVDLNIALKHYAG